MFNKEDFNKKLLVLLEFLELNKNKAPTMVSKAEFQCVNNELITELGLLEPQEFGAGLEEMKKLFGNKDLYKTYNVFHKLNEVEQKKNNWKVVIN